VIGSFNFFHIDSSGNQWIWDTHIPPACLYPSGNQTWQWKSSYKWNFHVKIMYNLGILHCHVSLLEGRSYWSMLITFHFHSGLKGLPHCQAVKKHSKQSAAGFHHQWLPGQSGMGSIRSSTMIWVNYNDSLTWNKAKKRGRIPLTNQDSSEGRTI